MHINYAQVFGERGASRANAVRAAETSKIRSKINASTARWLATAKLTTQEAGLAKWNQWLNLSSGGCWIRTGDNLPDGEVRCASSPVETNFKRHTWGRVSRGTASGDSRSVRGLAERLT